MESHWTSRHVSCIDNVAIILPTKVSQFKLACLMEGHQLSTFSLWFSKETCLIEWYQVLSHICWSFIEWHPFIATRPSHQTFLQARMQIMWYWNSTHVCLLPRSRICRNVCLLHHTSNNVCYNCTPTNRNAGYSFVGSVCMSVILVPDQQPSHYCHRVSRHLYHFHVWLSTHVWNQDSRPAVIYVTASRDYQACCSTHVFKLCSETAGMFVTVAPGYLAH